MAHEIIKGTFCSSGDRRELPVSPDAGEPRRMNYETGIPAICSASKTNGGVPPSREDFNEVYHLLLGNLFELQNGVFYGYDAATAAAIGGYPQGAILADPVNKRFVRSLVANNQTADLTDGTKWEKFTLSQADLGDKMDRDLSNISNTDHSASRNLAAEGIITVAARSYNPVDKTWYRVWSDGWCEQGGTIPTGSYPATPPNDPQTFTISMPLVMADTDFYASKTFYDSTNVANTSYKIKVFGMEIVDACTLRAYQYTTTTSARWRVEGFCDGIPVFTSGDISFGASDPTVKLVHSFYAQAGTSYCITLAGGGSPNSRGGMIRFIYKFPQQMLVNLKAINSAPQGAHPNSAGMATALYIEGALVAVAGGGAAGWGDEGSGGAGYIGGALASGVSQISAGYSIDGTAGDNSRAIQGADGGRWSSLAYGGQGYISPDWAQYITAIPGTDSWSHTVGTAWTGNPTGAYINVSKTVI